MLPRLWWASLSFSAYSLLTCFRPFVFDFVVVYTSHSAKFQLYMYSDWTTVQFPNLDLLPGTHCHGQLVFNMPSLSWHRHQDVGRIFNLLAIRGPTRSEGTPGIEPASPVLWSSHYLYTMVVGCFRPCGVARDRHKYKITIAIVFGDGVRKQIMSMAVSSKAKGCLE